MVTSIKKTQIAQIVLIAFLGFALLMPVASANAVTIALQGQIDPATIDITIDTATLNLDIATGDTEASDAINISSTAMIPVAMSLESFSHKAESWSPTLITTDPTTLGLTDAQSQARLTIKSNTEDDDYSVAPPATVNPTGTGSTVDGATYPVALGTIVDSDGTTSKDVVVTGTLEVSKKRILSKAFNSEMVLNFTAAE